MKHCPSGGQWKKITMICDDRIPGVNRIARASEVLARCSAHVLAQERSGYLEGIPCGWGLTMHEMLSYRASRLWIYSAILFYRPTHSCC